jgi:serine protease AprX
MSAAQPRQSRPKLQSTSHVKGTPAAKTVETSRKVLILPHSAVVAGLLQPQLGAVAVAAATSASSIPVRSSRDLLAHRRQSLTQFAETILNRSPIAVSVVRSMATSLASAATTAAKAPARQYTILEGLGAIITDEASVDKVSLESTGLGTVLDNVLIPMVPPLNQTPVTSARPNFWHHQSVKTSVAHDKGLDGTNILVGAVDTGIDSTHPEFAGKTVHFMEFDQNGSPVGSKPRDAGDHGTRVCGLIAGQQAGLAPKADLAVACVLTIPTEQGLSGYLVQIAAGLNWLLTSQFRGAEGDPGVEVVNASLGSPGYNNYLYQLLANARQSPGTGMIAAIGNAGRLGVNNHGSPGNYDIVLGIGAVDDQDDVAPFSDWGTVSQFAGLSKPDLSAPGVDVVSSVPGGGFMSMSGTSMASPIITGAAALLLQQNPALSFNVPGLFNRVLSLLRPFSSRVNQVRGGAGILDLTGI